MLTPIEIQRKSFKNGGFGYEKREVDLFLEEVQKDYEKLYKENVEYKDKINVLSDGLQYYKSIEKTLQKALVLAQRTADESHADAVKKADAIEKEAHLKAEQILQHMVVALVQVCKNSLCFRLLGEESLLNNLIYS